MGYQRGMSPQPAATVLTVEQARRLNAALRLELAALTAENAVLAPKVEAMRKGVTAARKNLTRQIRDLAAVRSQAERIVADPEPLHGGPDGLKAAYAEARAHGEGEIIVQPSTAKCGGRRKYETGCRCAECQGWRDRKTAREIVLKEQRLERGIAEALKNRDAA